MNDRKMIIGSAPGADAMGNTYVAREVGMYLTGMNQKSIRATASLIAASTYGLEPLKIVELATRIFEMGHQLDGNQFKFGSVFQDAPGVKQAQKAVFNKALIKNAKAVVDEWDEGITIKDQDLSLVTTEIAVMLGNIAQESAGKPQK